MKNLLRNLVCQNSNLLKKHLFLKKYNIHLHLNLISNLTDIESNQFFRISCCNLCPKHKVTKPKLLNNSLTLTIFISYNNLARKSLLHNFRYKQECHFLPL